MHPPPSTHSVEVQQSETGACVALVDDDPQILEVLSAWLESLGLMPCSFACAEDLMEALHAPNSTLQSRLVGAILDVNLKKMHGIDLAKRLLEFNPELPVVIITALHPDELAHVGTLPSKAVCLRKPFDLDQLENALVAWIH